MTEFDVFSKYPLKERLPPVGVHLPYHNCPPSNFIQISSTWDKGNRAVREKILRDFIANNRNKTGPQLEREFGNGASLFLTRITAWLRLTYLLGNNLSLQLQAISIFISASSGRRFLAEFLEVGGILTTLEILGLPQVKEPDKAEALRLLLHVAGAGRRFKEFICESFGVRSVTQCLAISKSEITQDYARNLLYQLGLGNPKFLMQVYKSLLSILTSTAPSPTAQQMAGQALRLLLPSINVIHSSLVDTCVGLLRSMHIQIQYEAYEILKDLMGRTMLQDIVMQQLIAVLRTSIDDRAGNANTGGHKNKAEDSHDRTAGWKGILTQSDETSKKQSDALTSIYIQQAYAAKLLGVMSATSREAAEREIQLQVIGGLLNVISNVAHPESQRYATNTLQFLVESFDYVSAGLRQLMGQNFVDLLESKPDTFYKELSREQIRYLRKNNVSIDAENSNLLIDNESGSDSSEDDEKGDKNPSTRGRSQSGTKARTAAFPTSHGDSEGISAEVAQPQEFVKVVKNDGDDVMKTKEEIITDYEKLAEQKPEEKCLIQELYLPFALPAPGNAFAGNKFESKEVETKESEQTILDRLKLINQQKLVDDKVVEYNELENDSILKDSLEAVRNNVELFGKGVRLAATPTDDTDGVKKIEWTNTIEG